LQERGNFAVKTADKDVSLFDLIAQLVDSALQAHNLVERA
jgi:hypothetical protein